ncbi:integrin alpha FG-GAP repeat-containing protein 2 [Modicella reniformis]|uniref:Integrin alpha FG-GAP repeat-containing protein 2 n=1 Tax=Modicella reniformis TaxID=1440133 RepID=A0A9P6ML41_9FUNG|nr:integrin alpha FG-GAP repeat-containing protein 2 [Modicella reniformis]
MPTTRHVSLVQKLRWHVSGNISPTAFAIGDVDGNGDNEFVIGNLVGDLFIFKNNHPEGQPWLTCKGLGTITAVTIGDIRNCGKNSIVVMSAEGLCHIFDVAGLDDDPGVRMFRAPAAGSRPGHGPSVYPSTPQHGLYQGSSHGHHGNGAHPFHPSIPATPSIRPVPDIHGHHHPYHGHHGYPHHGAPPIPPPPQNTSHGSTSSSVSGFHHLPNTPNNTPIHSHTGSIYSGIGARRGSEAFLGSATASITRTTAVLASLIGTPPVSASLSHGPGVLAAASTSVSIAGSALASAAASMYHSRSIGGNSVANSPTGTPLLKPQQPLNGVTPGPGSRDHALRRSQAGTARNSMFGKGQVRVIGGRRVLDKPNLTLPVPVNINRVYIADIDGDGLNEIVLARTDRILHSYSLQTSKAVSPTNVTNPNNQQLSLVKLLSRTSSISTLDNSGLFSPSDDKRDTVIHPSLSFVGRQYFSGSTPTVTGTAASQGNPDSQDNDNNCAMDSSTRLILVERKRWALDGQVHCLAVTKDINTGMPILLVAQPGLKFVMVDHNGNMSEPITQIQRCPKTTMNAIGPDTPTRSVGSGDVATDIICGAFALHDLENNTVKVHDLDSNHKIFGFSKLSFGQEYLERLAARGSSKDRKDYGRNNGRYADENTCDEGDNDGEDDDDMDRDGETRPHEQADSDVGGIGGYTKRANQKITRKPAASMLISEPFGSRFPKDDMFVGCSWSGITFFIDQDFNTVRYDFDARVCAFGAGQYAVTPGRNEPCLFYVDFEDNIYVYYNLYIQTEPPARFQDVVNADTSLICASQRISARDDTNCKDQGPWDSSTVPTSIETVQCNLDNTPVPNIQDNRHSTTSWWTEHGMKDFVHSSLYNVNRYEDEFQRLKRLADIELAKRAAFLDAEASKERTKLETVKSATVVSDNVEESLSTVDARLQQSQHSLSAERPEELDSNPKSRPGYFPNKVKAAQRGQFSGHDISTSLGSASSHYTRTQRDAAHQDDDDHPVSPLSPLSPVLASSPNSSTDYQEKRRSSLLIKDVLSHYEGKVTPPLKSPTSPSIHSSQPLKDYKNNSPQSSSRSSTTLTSIMKRISSGSRLSRSSASSGSSGGGSGSGSGSGSSQVTITQSHPLLGAQVSTKSKGLEAKVGKALQVNRLPTGSRTRTMGVTGRKRGGRSRLSQQQDREDDTEEEDEQAPSEDGTGEVDGDNLLELDQSSRKSAGEDVFQQGQDFEADLAGDDFYNRARGNEANEGEEDFTGVYTPSTISPIPSPGRLYGNQPGSVAEPSPSLDGSAFILAKGLLSPSARSMPGVSTSVTTIAGVMSKTSRQVEQGGNHGVSSMASSRGHVRQRSGHGLLDVGLSQQPSREATTSSGINSGPNSAGHSSVQDGRRSRAESVLSTGSDIGGVIVPDITLLASSFPMQSNIPLSASELPSHAASTQDSSESEDDINETSRSGHQDGNEESTEGQQQSVVACNPGARRPPRRSATLGSQDSSGHGAGSGSDTATAKSSNLRSKRSIKGVDLKLMPAPLSRSNQHHQHQKQQSVQPRPSGGLTGSHGSKDAPTSSSSHTSFTLSSRSSCSGGGGDFTTEGQRGGGEALSRIVGGKSSSTTSSATVSDFGSGPSSPLTSNIIAANAILSNPSSNSYKGFGVLSIPLASPSVSTASVQQHQYFVASHHHGPPHSGSSLYSVNRASIHEDDKMSIRSKTSTLRGTDDNHDISIVPAANTSSVGPDSIYGMSPASTSTENLVSDSLVRRLEELQQHDRELEEKQRQKDREKEKDKGKEKAKVTQVPRPSALSRANSGASVQSSVSHHRIPSYSPTSHGSTSGSGPPSGPVSGPASASGMGFGRQTLEDDRHDPAKRSRSRPGLGQGL